MDVTIVKLSVLLKIASFCLGAVVAVGGIGYGVAIVQRPSRDNMRLPLFAGIDYERTLHAKPRMFVKHVVTVDLAIAGVNVFVTPGTEPQPFHNREFMAQTTSAALERYQLQLAVNGSFFYPFRALHPWDFYPHSGDPVGALGQVISNDVSYSPAQTGWAVLCMAKPLSATIASERCPSGTQHAIAGRELLLQSGQTLRSDDDDSDRLYPRTAVALSADGMKLWLIVIDGRQPFYSRGVTLTELSEIVLELGANTALNLDGGGSATLAIASAGKTQVLNSPIHTSVPTRQRPIANHLGFYARPLAP